MRTITLFDGVDASSNQTSASFEVECGKDMRWSITITTSGTTLPPNFIIEASNDNSTWYPIEDEDTGLFHFVIDDSPYGIRDDRWMEKYMRVRLEPNLNTTGTLTAKLGFKTYSN